MNRIEHQVRAVGLLLFSLPILIGSSPQTEGAGRSTVFSLLADNRLLAIDSQTGKVVSERKLVPYDALLATGHLMAQSKDGKSLFVLTRSGKLGAPDRVFVVDVATARVRSDYACSENGGAFRSLAVGDQTGRIYLFGNRDENAIVVATMLDPNTGEILKEWVVKPREDKDWLVYQGGVSFDERRLFLSFHGMNTSGIDWFDVTPTGLSRCQSCFTSSHGGFAVYGDGLLAATGSQLILEVDKSGKVMQGHNTGLRNTHLMEFAVDLKARRLYAVGSCGYTPGFCTVDLEAGAAISSDRTAGWHFAAEPKKPLVYTGEHCGERLSLGSKGLAVIAQTAKPVPSLGPGRLLFVDSATGKLIRRSETPAEPLDVLAVSVN